MGGGDYDNTDGEDEKLKDRNIIHGTIWSPYTEAEKIEGIFHYNTKPITKLFAETNLELNN